MNEKGLYAAVDKHVPKWNEEFKPKRKGIHRQSMTGTVFGGTVDRYYDGTKSDLWAEYKMLRAKPRIGIVIGAYTPGQRRWMQRRWETKMNVVGIVGVPIDGKVMVALQFGPNDWDGGTPLGQLRTPREVAEWITSYCGS
jgi:hypothetical protein